MNFGETEAARLPGETIAQQRERIRLYADFSKQRLHLLFRCLEREVPNVQFLHGRSPGPCQFGTCSQLRNETPGRKITAFLYSG
jgi:hypothetical protein